MKLTILALAILAVLGFILVPNVAGISVTMSTDDVSITDEYSLADETDLLADVTLMDGVAVQSTIASGSKQNAMSTQAGSTGYGAQAAVSTDGEFSASTMTVASKEGAVLLSRLAGTGSAIAEVRGVSGADAAGQQAAVFNGAMNSAQMVAVGGFVGEAGTMNGQTMSGSSGFAAGTGNVAINDVESL